jgi:hypothetical protein
MVFNFYLTTILNAGSWGAVTKPYIVEYLRALGKRDDSSKFDFSRFDNFRRILRIAVAPLKREEKGFGREDDGKSYDTFEVTAKCVTYLDAQNIIEQIRDIIIKSTKPNESTYQPTYSDIDIPADVDISEGRGIFYFSFICHCSKIGKVRTVAQ